MQWGCQWPTGTISGTCLLPSALEIDDVDMVLQRKFSQLCCMLQLSNKPLGAQKSPWADYACQALAKFGKIESTSRNREKVYSWQAHHLAEFY
ncbi:MAG: hypothetical protein IPM02_00940 [Betaproteobacteria bacterium]|nr:hypothetical protein [Betaproteobacteria bacterium]